MAYYTKGRRDKRLPVIPAIDVVLRSNAIDSPTGLIYLRRDATSVGRQLACWIVLPGDGDGVPTPLRHRHHEHLGPAAVTNQFLHNAGGKLRPYCHGVRQGNAAAGLARSATIKDSGIWLPPAWKTPACPSTTASSRWASRPAGRHLTYTHLNAIREKFNVAAAGEFHPLVEAIERRTGGLHARYQH